MMVSGVQGTLPVQHATVSQSAGGGGGHADRPTARRTLIDQDDLGEKLGKWLRGISTVEVGGGGGSSN